MNLDWLLSPITQYSILVLGLLSCLGLCISTAARVRARRTPPPVPQPDPDANLSRHARALLMHRRGECASAIATALQTPRNEIELLLKIRGNLT